MGDVVLLKEKTTSNRLEWPTGVITSAVLDKDNLVRRVIVQPHKKQGQTTTPKPRERAIHDLVLIKSLIAKDNTTTKDAPEEAMNLMYSTYAEERRCSSAPHQFI